MGSTTNSVARTFLRDGAYVTASSGVWHGPFGYAGGFGYQEDTTGLRLLGHRYYDPSTGRFLTRDPIKDGRNWYVYCESDPVNGVDPDGLKLTHLYRLLTEAGELVKWGITWYPVKRYTKPQMNRMGAKRMDIVAEYDD